MPDLNILVADDDALLRELAIRMLKQLGYYGDAVSSGQAALSILAEKQYDLALIDIQMPHMSGLDVAYLVQRNYPPEKRPYLVAITASSLDSDRDDIIRAGFDDYVQKPLLLQNLRDLLDRYASRSEQAFALGEREMQLLAPGEHNLLGHSFPEDVVIDEASWMSLRQMIDAQSPGGLLGMLRDYFDDAEDLIRTMQAAVRASDPIPLAKAAHRLKSSSAIFGAFRLADLCNRLELLAYEGKLKESAECFQQVEHEYKRVYAALREKMGYAKPGERQNQVGGP
jgi:CheY-like chemotaxis protein